MYGSSLRLVTRMPREARMAARDEAAMPFPSEETTPPVTNTNLVMGDKFWKFAVYPNSIAATNRCSTRGTTRVMLRVRASVAPRYEASPRSRRASVRSRPTSCTTASMAGVCGTPVMSARTAIMTCGGLS